MARAEFLTKLYLVAAFVLLLCAAGCVRRDGRNSDCRWPAETGEYPASAWHLSRDAEFAEDLAIRDADLHYWHTPYWAGYAAARDRCMGTLFEQVAKEHGATVERVYSSIGRNRGSIDLAENLPFVLLYCFVAAAATRMIWRRYPAAEEGWTIGVTIRWFWSRHGTALFASMLILFWLAAIEVTRRMRPMHSSPVDRDLQSHPYGQIF